MPISPSLLTFPVAMAALLLTAVAYPACSESLVRLLAT